MADGESIRFLAALNRARTDGTVDHDLRDQISRRLDDYDREHEIMECGSQTGHCLHAATTALRAILRTLNNRQLATVAAMLGVDGA